MNHIWINQYFRFKFQQTKLDLLIIYDNRCSGSCKEFQSKQKM